MLAVLEPITQAKPAKASTKTTKQPAAAEAGQQAQLVKLLDFCIERLRDANAIVTLSMLHVLNVPNAEERADFSDLCQALERARVLIGEVSGNEEIDAESSSWLICANFAHSMLMIFERDTWSDGWAQNLSDELVTGYLGAVSRTLDLAIDGVENDYPGKTGRASA